MKSLIYVFLLFPILVSGQRDMAELLEGTGFAYEYILDDDGERIEYIITPYQASQRGLILYTTGSLPMPLYFIDDGYMYPTLPFYYLPYSEEYQFAVISKPGIEVVEAIEQMDEQYLVINEKGIFREAYLRKNYAGYYIDSTIKVLDVLTQKHAYTDIVLMGHSQGARISTAVSMQDQRITHLINLGSDVHSRFQAVVKQVRVDALQGKITEEEAQETIEEYYEKWKGIVADPESLAWAPGDSNKTWLSFDSNRLTDLLNLEIPIYFAYGTQDVCALNCDVLPLHFIERGKTNFTSKAYLGYDHRFQKLTPDGTIDNHFRTVVDDSIVWLRKQ